MYSQNDFRSYELYHYGILGQKWGVRRYQNSDGSLTSAGKERYGGTSTQEYRSTSLSSAIARYQNKKVDKSFDKWREKTEKKESAVELGKAANEARLRYKNDPTKENKAALKAAEKSYKKSLKDNTTYKKGQVKHDVDSDMARKYLSEAKKVKKLLDQDPENKELQRQYSEMMSQHDIYRASARRAPEVAAKRSAAVANVKRGVTMTLKGAAATAAVAVGAYAVNKVLQSEGVNIHIDSDTINKTVNVGKKILNASKYIYF